MNTRNHYFAGLDADQAIKEFRRLCKVLHPDMQGGNPEAFRNLVDEYQDFQRQAKTAQGRAEGWTDKATGEPYEAPDMHLSPETLERLETVLRWPGLIVELLGTWIWITGDTRQYSEQFKALAFRWSPKKQAWYFHAEPYKRRSRHDYTLDEIRARHGQTSFTQKPQARIPDEQTRP